MTRCKVIIERSKDGGYTTHVPELPGCISEGDTLEEARRNIAEAMKLYLEENDSPDPPISNSDGIVT